MAKQAEIGCLGGLGVLCLFGIPLFGVASLISGISEQVEYNHTYVVSSDYPGRDCSPGKVVFSVTDGAVLDCTLKGVTPMGPVVADLPGFTEAQDKAVTALAEQLGRDGLQVVDVEKIQERVDQVARTLPPESRPNYHQNMRIGPLWGSSLAWFGGGILLAVALIAIALRIRQLRIRQLRIRQLRRT